MALNIIVYYQPSINESTDDVILRIEKLINSFDQSYIVKGVYIEQKDFETLSNILNLDFNEINYIYINKRIDDEFYDTVFGELISQREVEVIYFK